MSDEDREGEEVELPGMSALLKRSLTHDAVESPTSAKDDSEKDRLLLASVQRKLRQRSNGKFYGDGWSTGASRINYPLVACVMLIVIVAVYVALGPIGIALH